MRSPKDKGKLFYVGVILPKNIFVPLDRERKKTGLPKSRIIRKILASRYGVQDDYDKRGPKPKVRKDRGNGRGQKAVDA